MTDREASCPQCHGKGTIQKSAMGTRLYRWVVDCKACGGSGFSVEEMARQLRAADSHSCPTGRWVDGCGPGHRIWKNFDDD